MRYEIPQGKRASAVEIEASSQPEIIDVEQEGNAAKITLWQPIRVPAGQSLTVCIKLAPEDTGGGDS
jgi:hypothetical protein